MALLRGLRRRLRQMNPCTSCLVVVFLAVVLYLISAIRGVYVQSSSALMVADGQRDELGPGVADRRRLSSLDGGPAGQRRRRKNRTGFFVVGDDEVQLCKMTSRWASSAIEQEDYIHQPKESVVSGQAGMNSCSSGPPSTLFYIDAEGALAYNHTAAAADGKYEAVAGSCTAWKIEWNLEAGYAEKKVSMLAEIESDFVHVRCRLRRHRDDDDDDEGNVERRTASRTPGSRRRKRSEGDIAERRARQLHRDQLRRHSPHFVGTVGLPDPFSRVITEQQTSSSDAAESREHVTPNERRSRPTVQELGSATHTVDEVKPAIQGRELDVRSLSRSERDLNQADGSNDDDNDARTEIYDQWIAQIHPLDEVVDLEGAGDVGKRLNVLVLALESVSSITFDRDLPKSHRFLVDRPHTTLFTGYNVIGDAAPANIIPLLTGAPIRVVIFCVSLSNYRT